MLLGLWVSCVKTKIQSFNDFVDHMDSFIVGKEPERFGLTFIFLGSMLLQDGQPDIEVNRRVGLSPSTFVALQTNIRGLTVT